MDFTFNGLTNTDPFYPLVSTPRDLIAVSGFASETIDYKLESRFGHAVVRTAHSSDTGILLDNDLIMGGILNDANLQISPSPVSTGRVMIRLRGIDVLPSIPLMAGQQLVSESYITCRILPNPNTFGPVERWYMADNAGITLNPSDGADLTVWADKSNNADHLYSTNPSLFPIYRKNQFNFLPAVYWTGNAGITGVGMSGSGILANREFTTFACFYSYSTDVNSTSQCIYGERGTPNINTEISLRPSNSGVFSQYSGNAFGKTRRPSLFNTLNFIGVSIKVTGNPISGLTLGLYYPNQDTLLSNPGIPIYTGFYNTVGPGTRPFTGAICEILCYSTGFTIAQMTNVLNSYFRPKWFGEYVNY